ncbi:MAG TPA: SgcJ/EcaC family oxidoreductase [Solirubrobacterales bacterium]
MGSTPEGTIRRFAERLNQGDVEGALELYEAEAAFVPEPGTIVNGRERIREALQRFAALKPTLTGEIRGVREGGDVALVFNRWHLDGEGPDGPIEMSGTSADVLRRQEDGSWRVLIDDPWGGR